MSTSETSLYGYIPTAWIGWTFVVLFGISTVTHIIQTLFIKPRLYWLLPTVVLCGIFEVTGWVARARSHKDPNSSTNFIIQASLIIIAPVFITAALYTILGKIINIVGENYSRLRSNSYIKIFLGADIVSLFIQGAGGGLSASAGTKVQTAKLGTNITLGGVIFQIVFLFFFSILAIEVAYRVSHNKPHVHAMEGGSRVDRTRPTDMFWMLLGLGMSTALVFVRTIYRSIELSKGFNGSINRTQIWIILFDGIPMVLAMIILNAFSPTHLLKSKLSYENRVVNFRLNPRDQP
ncbi:hypothetical protein M422DRAFT_233532 [Sphaerobolus stellatus SS14]|uniref:RTA1-domain-containing protein n=1 Tax=Sphaerobolus stellatus (strain SS14) TaxID=990650 RepID=A0A0C9TUY4_SPHS4|nr:hypothetical protein M422DRAFT_233532 [Sphaerobolus stellatus SS14]